MYRSKRTAKPLMFSENIWATSENGRFNLISLKTPSRLMASYSDIKLWMDMDKDTDVDTENDTDMGMDIRMFDTGIGDQKKSLSMRYRTKQNVWYRWFRYRFQSDIPISLITIAGLTVHPRQYKIANNQVVVSRGHVRKSSSWSARKKYLFLRWHLVIFHRRGDSGDTSILK